MTFSSVCVCIGQLFWKLGADGQLLFLGAGFILYGIGALAMIISYKFGKLSVLQPVLSLNYVLSIILAATVLNETITLLKCLGILTIIIGICLIAVGDHVPD